MAQEPQCEALVEKARDFAVQAHKSMNHRRKYTEAPYSVHLQNVVDLVASVTDEAEVLAAAWLHDVVEDTAATLEDVEASFGKSTAYLVDSLTDVSKPSDGDRAVRKELDRRHLAGADPRAKTIKLADLIDNCRDICKHNKRFAKVYLQEMDALLQVLGAGDPILYGIAFKTHADGSVAMSKDFVAEEAPADDLAEPRVRFGNPRLVHLFTHAFTVKDIAEPLRSLDRNRAAAEAHAIMSARSLSVMGLRENGEICGYIRLTDDPPGTGSCREHLREFRPGQIIGDDCSLSEVIQVLSRQEYAFVTVFGVVAGFVGRGHLNSPVTRMWLFGILTLFEMGMVNLIRKYFADESWRPLVPATRLEKALALQQERSRRRRQSPLVECLQLSDKGQILLEHPLGPKLLDIRSKAAAKRMIKSMESLRNNLAHGQDVVKYDWASIAAIAGRIEEASYLNRFGLFPGQDGPAPDAAQ
jgi:hypothetical protein